MLLCHMSLSYRTVCINVISFFSRQTDYLIPFGARTDIVLNMEGLFSTGPSSINCLRYSCWHGPRCGGSVPHWSIKSGELDSSLLDSSPFGARADIVHQVRWVGFFSIRLESFRYSCWHGPGCGGPIFHWPIKSSELDSPPLDSSPVLSSMLERGLNSVLENRTGLRIEFW